MIRITSALLTVAIILPLALAAPAPELDHVQGEEALEASVKKRTTIDNITTRSQFTDGEGTYINSDSGHHYASGVKCWNDYFIVNQNIGYLDWIVSK